MEILEPYSLRVPQSEGKRLSRLKKETLLLTEEYQADSQSYLVKGFAQKKAPVLRKKENDS